MDNFVLKIIKPEKYKEKCSVSKIIADCKIYTKGVELYKKRIQQEKHIKPIVLVKHPEKDKYAVLDGHHRFYAFVESGSDEIDCSIIKTSNKAIFNGVKKGRFQPPHPLIRKYLHIPIQRILYKIKDFIISTKAS